MYQRMLILLWQVFSFILQLETQRELWEGLSVWVSQVI